MKLSILKCGATIPINISSSITASAVMKTEKTADSFTPEALSNMNTTLNASAEGITPTEGYKKCR